MAGDDARRAVRARGRWELVGGRRRGGGVAEAPRWARLPRLPSASALLQRREEGLAAMGRRILAPRAAAGRRRPAAVAAHPWTSRAAAAPERPASEPLHMGAERREMRREEVRGSEVRVRARAPAPKRQPAPLAAAAGRVQVLGTPRIPQFRPPSYLLILSC